MSDKILVLDFGSQYNQLIARRIREFGVYSELLPHSLSLEEIKAMSDIKGIIFSGGPNSVYDTDSFKVDSAILTSGIPLLGVCYGMQLIHHMLGGKVEASAVKEYGEATISTKDSKLFKDLPKEQTVWMSHGDQVVKPALDFDIIASTDTCPIAATYNTKHNIYTVQFHPEVRNTVYGLDILKNFVFDICGCKNDWSMHDFAKKAIEDIKNEVKDEKVLLGLSGGVDSSVAATLLAKAIGKNLYCMFIDHGLLRKGEADQVEEMCKKHMPDINFIRVDASTTFLEKLKGIDDPEKKRKIIGNEFVYTFDREIKRLLKDEDIKYLAQGTLYTDIIESGTKTAQTIKSHHNVGGLPKDMDFKLIEPLKTLFKDEVRALGKELGLDDEVVYRQPFPGPGLGIRVIGAIDEERLAIVRESDYILREEIKKAGLDSDIWQYFTACLDNKSVGVMGDQRTYEYTVAIRAVTSIDGMTADWAKIPHDILGKIANRIVNEVRGCNRVVYDITSKPPGTVEFE